MKERKGWEERERNNQRIRENEREKGLGGNDLSYPGA